MGKSDLKTERKSASSSKKRKLSEVEDQPEIDSAAAVAPKKAKKEKSSKKDKKEKKDKKDKKPKKGSKEAKAAETEALNGEYDVDDQAMADDEPVKTEAAAEEPSKKAKKEKKEKKDKKKEKKDKKNKAEEETTVVDGETKEKKAKKASKKEKKAASDDTKESSEKQTGDVEADDHEEGQKSGKKSRFICFVGNLPFSATTTDIQQHFATLQPSSIRLLTQRDNPTKSRGIAFVEFSNYSHMKTCLAKFHHTDFTDATGAQRRINVELTAGGGGNTGARREKVQVKNAKLNEERARRIAREEEEKAAGKKDREEVDAKKKAAAAVDTREDAYVHPSRRAHVPGRRS